MPGGYKGEVAQFNQAHKNVDANTQELMGTLRAVENAANEVRAGWGGPAGDAFQVLIGRFQEAGTDMNKALMNIGELLQTAGSTYEQMEEEASSDVSGIMKALG